ncbi:hypothetical protein EV401DRAFT_920253 [Pisolithus croceorrhizus]|nr:hypothetical protein EV401DRAFT_920253 [Pisolithus croceorrhizus]
MLVLARSWMVVAGLSNRAPSQSSVESNCPADQRYLSPPIQLDNSKSQNPCLVAAYVQSVCVDGPFTIYSLGPDTEYFGPLALALTVNIAATSIGIPGLPVARRHTWDTQRISPVALLYHNGLIKMLPYVLQHSFRSLSNLLYPESTATNAQVTASSISTSTDLAASLTPSPSPSSSLTSFLSASKSNNAGAIAGGVVGGVVGLTAVAADK